MRARPRLVRARQFRRGDPRPAAVHLAQPSFAQGYFALGYALVWAGREEEAIALLERATELTQSDPRLWTFHHARALAHFCLNEIEAAAEWARQASRLPNATHSPHATL